MSRDPLGCHTKSTQNLEPHHILDGASASAPASHAQPTVYTGEVPHCQRPTELHRRRLAAVAAPLQLSIPSLPPVNFAFLISAAFIWRGTPKSSQKSPMILPRDIHGVEGIAGTR